MKIQLPFINNANKETIEDYVRWRGDLSFQDNPFNLIDSMVFCWLSYVDFSKVIKPNCATGSTLKEYAQQIFDQKCYSLQNLYGGHEDFFQAIAQSNRFGSVHLCNYIDIFEEVDQVQFSAVEFVIAPKVSYIAYRGTDNSLVGWKEDFMIAFRRIKAQDYAKEYLERVMKPRHKYYIGGHSKGGNLAKYACAWLTEQKLKNVIRIYDFDGPGFCPEVFDLHKLDKLADMVTRIIPEFCVIGKVFEVPFKDQYIVYSKESGANQHDIISWCINGIKLDLTDKNDQTSEWLDQTIAQWVDGATQEERETFVNEFFNSLAAGNAKTMQEVLGKGLPNVIKAMVDASPTSKKLVVDLASVALGVNKK